ncbi:MAG: hypothetical protein KDJ70_20280 [Candidatus Competibacteraceae bacterium]|nr:hypothetical protein [Candidatus Competibacteraceae bacterium]
MPATNPATPFDSPTPLSKVPDPAPEESESWPTVEDADEGWKYDFLEFKGDRLEVRKPTAQALAAYSLASSKYVSNQIRNDMTGLFISRHLSDASYEQVFSRLMDPDEEEYGLETIGDLMRKIVELSSAAS